MKDMWIFDSGASKHMTYQSDVSGILTFILMKMSMFL